MTTDSAIARVERCLHDDEIFTLRRVARGDWEAWSYDGEVGRGATPAAALLALEGKLR